MARVAKADVMKAFEHVAKLINDAGGPDGISSRADLKAKAATLSGTEKALFDVYSRFIDHRDHKPGARITAKDIEKALAFTAKEMVADYDENRNGLSKDEIAKMSTSAQLAVELAKELGLLQKTRSPIDFTEQSVEPKLQGNGQGPDVPPVGIWMGTAEQRKRLFTRLAQERLESGAAAPLASAPKGFENAESYKFGPQGADVGSTVYLIDNKLYVEQITIAGSRWFDAGPAPMF